MSVRLTGAVSLDMPKPLTHILQCQLTIINFHIYLLKIIFSCLPSLKFQTSLHSINSIKLWHAGSSGLACTGPTPFSSAYT
jgi:hypothetical protein